jgi:uncharacterized membrane protein
MSQPPARRRWRHPVNVAMDTDQPLGARVADDVAAFIGSWKFLVIQTILVVIWITGNMILLFHFDPYPFILLNLAFSTQAAYAAPLILLASNRAAVRDRLTLEHAATETDLEERQNEELLEGDRRILEQVAGLEQRILDLEGAIKRAVDRLEAGGAAPGPE